MATTTQQQNVNDEEVQKFNDLSQYWWDKKGPLRTLHQVQPTRMQFIQEQCELKNKKIVDVGCGGGLLTEALAQYSPDVTGIDLAPDSLQVAQLHATGMMTPPQYEQSSAEAYAQRYSDHFEIVTCLELIEHVPCADTLMSSLAKLLIPGGDLFVSTLNRSLQSYMTAIVGAEYLLNLIPKGTHEYKSFIKPSELDASARKYGLRLEALKGLNFRPLFNDFVLNSNTQVNYIVHFKKELL